MRKSVFIILTFLCAFSGTAQQFNFKNFKEIPGIGDGSINALFEDQRGNLWIGTNSGLFKYDGYDFVAYRKDDGLPSDVVLSIMEDSASMLWIGSDKGIGVFDGREFTTLNFFHTERVSKILQDQQGVYWIGTGSRGVFRYDGKVLLQVSGNDEASVNEIHSLLFDDEQVLWAATNKGLGKYTRTGWEYYAVEDGLPSTDIYSIAEDNNHVLWIGTRTGLVTFDQVSFSIVGANDAAIRNTAVNAVAVDAGGDIWIGTGNGISKWNGKSFNHYTPQVSQEKNRITSILNDSGGNIWFGSAEQGLSRLDSERFIHFAENDQLGKRVFSIIQAINGNIICGTSLGGTTVFDGKNYSLLNKKDGFTSSVVQAFHYGPDSTLWVGTQDDGLFGFSKTGANHFTREEGLISDNISGITTDRSGNLWVASDRGLMSIQLAADTIAALRLYSQDNGLISNRISAIAADESGAIWLGTEGNGITRISIANDSVVISNLSESHGLKRSTIHSIITDTSNRVYFGTGHGILVIEGMDVQTYSKDQGLVSNTVYSLTIDNEQNLWAGTDRGVDRVSFSADRRDVVVRHFNQADGFRGGEVYRNSSCLDRDGNLWFGTINGLVKYNPREEVGASIKPRMHLTGIKLFFDRIEDTPYGDSVSGWYPLPVALTLPYNQNNLTFSFVGIHHRNPESVRYKWLLDGFSNGWSPPLKEREAVFSNLPPGKYTFKVIACNEYNVWTEDPVEYFFEIEAPWWQWWWIRLATAGVMVALLSAIFYIRIQRIRAKSNIVQERLEMENSILQLEQEASRLQMNPHFIFNCLNSIQGFIAVNEGSQAKVYLAKFGKLMRLMLENSREEFIPLEQEILMLENYLALERIAIGQDFKFSITVDESIDPLLIEIPPMMIQPFVENAVIHGIRTKTGSGKITIHFNIERDVLVCEVTDNGIGREQSAMLNAAARPGHKSTAISVTRKRLQQYGTHRKVEAGITFVDLKDNGLATGTKVIISTPYEGG